MDQARQRFRGRFQLIDAATGKPIGGRATRVRCTDGQCVNGTTDADGYTGWVECAAAETLTLDLNTDHPA